MIVDATPTAAQRRVLLPLDAMGSETPAPPERYPGARSPLEALFDQSLLQHRRLFAEMQVLRPALCEAATLMARRLCRNGRLMFCGNGVAGPDSAHLAAEFNHRLGGVFPPRLATALDNDETPSPSGNQEYGIEYLFARQINAIGHANDCLVVLSASGDSINILRALKTARSKGVASVALLGRGGGHARALADVSLVVPHDDRARIQEAQIFIGHTLCRQIEAALGLTS